MIRDPILQQLAQEQQVLFDRDAPVEEKEALQKKIEKRQAELRAEGRFQS